MAVLRPDGPDTDSASSMPAPNAARLHPDHCRYPQQDCHLKLNPVAENNCAVEGETRLRTISTSRASPVLRPRRATLANCSHGSVVRLELRRANGEAARQGQCSNASFRLLSCGGLAALPASPRQQNTRRDCDEYEDG